MRSEGIGFVLGPLGFPFTLGTVLLLNMPLSWDPGDFIIPTATGILFLAQWQFVAWLVHKRWATTYSRSLASTPADTNPAEVAKYISGETNSSSARQALKVVSAALLCMSLLIGWEAVVSVKSATSENREILGNDFRATRSGVAQGEIARLLSDSEVKTLKANQDMEKTKIFIGSSMALVGLTVLIILFAWQTKAPNQLPDPTSPPVTPPAGAGAAPSVAADH